MRRTYYDELGVATDATRDQIQDAYLALAQRYHPDVNRRPDANARMASINLAYETLSDPERRARYDLEIGLGGMPAGQTPEPPGPQWQASPPGKDTEGAFPFARSMTRWIIGGAVVILAATLLAFVVNGGPLFDDWTFNTTCARRGGCPTAIEQCYLDHGSYTRGWPPQTDAAVKQKLDECLAQARAVTPTPGNP